METKHTKEHAEKLAKEDSEFLAYYEDKEFAKIKFIEGYMKAIEETAVAELLEALISSYSETIEQGKPSPETIGKMINAINKANQAGDLV